MLFQPRICATKTGPAGQKQRIFQDEDGFDFRDAATRRLISAELRRFSPDSVTVHPPDVVCRSGFSLKNQQQVRGKCKPLVNHVCSLIHDQLRREKLVFLGAPWPAWSEQKIQAMEKLGVTRSRETCGKKQVLGGSVIRKPGTMFVPPSVVEQGVILKSGLDLKKLSKTVSLEQVKTLVRELEQEDVCDMEVDLAKVRWQESDIEMLNVFAQDLETAVECLPAEEDEDEDVIMRDDEHHGGSDVEEQVPMKEGGEHDEAAPEGEVHSRHDVERVTRALRKFHTNLGHPGVKEMVRVLKHGRASEMAI